VLRLLLCVFACFFSSTLVLFSSLSAQSFRQSRDVWHTKSDDFIVEPNK
jgi:hypothetical protein